ncbi:MAG: glycosyltransferase family 4 protein [Armatimonadota bacterium]|nr:glycosyltransferase family 4 protein [bacterium]
MPKKRLKILFLAHLLPLPLDSGGKIKSYYTLKALAAGHDVRMLAYVRSDEEMDCLDKLRSVCDEIEIVPLKRGKLQQVCDLARAMVTGKSFIVNRDYRRDMQDAFNRIVAEFQPDVVHIDHLQMAQFVDFSGRYRKVLDNHNVESMIIKRIADTSEMAPARMYAGLEWPKLRAYEIDVCRRADRVLTVSDEDKSTLDTLCSGTANTACVPIGVDVHYFEHVDRTQGSKNILSIGTMYWPPNVDSMLYFCREILPLVKAEIPGCTVTIAGQRPVESIRALASDPSVRVTGYVSDSRRESKDCGVFVVPLRSGSGVRVKILNALAMGLPVVSTSIGAEGLAVESGKHLMIADTPEDFARAVVNVLGSPELADKIGRSGRALICELYSWEKVGERLLSVYDELAGGGS